MFAFQCGGYAAALECKILNPFQGRGQGVECYKCGLLDEKIDKPKSAHIHQAQVGQLEVGDDRQRHER